MITLNKEDAFTIVDIISKAQEIVRCKDCKYWEEESSGRTYCERTIFWTNMDADDFCSRGEKKMIDGYDDNFSTTDRPIYVKPASINPSNIYIKGKWLDETKDQYANVFIDDKPLIRCKDCRFWGTEQDGYCAAIDDPYMLETEADDFCSRGERRDDNTK